MPSVAKKPRAPVPAGARTLRRRESKAWKRDRTSTRSWMPSRIGCRIWPPWWSSPAGKPWPPISTRTWKPPNGWSKGMSPSTTGPAASRRTASSCWPWSSQWPWICAASWAIPGRSSIWSAWAVVTVAEGALVGGRGLPGAPDSALRALADHVGRMCAGHGRLRRGRRGGGHGCLPAKRAGPRTGRGGRRRITEVLDSRHAPRPGGHGAGRILAARSFERIGAHAANVAETVVFVLKGATLSQQCQPH